MCDVFLFFFDIVEDSSQILNLTSSGCCPNFNHRILQMKINLSED